MANTSPATCQCLATFTPLTSNILIFCHDVISLLARVVILLMGFSGTKKPGGAGEQHSHSTRHGSSPGVGAGSFVDLFLLCRCTDVFSWKRKSENIKI